MGNFKGGSFGEHEDTTGENKSISTFTLFIISLSGFSGFLTGYNMAVLSGSMILVKDEFNLNDTWHMLIVSVSVGSAAISALGGGYLSDKILGRKLVIMISSAMFVTGSVILACSPVKATLLVGQVFIGLGAGEYMSTSVVSVILFQ